MSQVKERPILFSAPMVRAILEGRKTVTRRVIDQKLTNRFDEPRGHADVTAGYPFVECDDGYWPAINFCPYGQPGDRLWVRETWIADSQVDGIAPRDLSQGEPLLYPADGAMRQTGCSLIEPGKPRPSIHMPRWVSRILLEITDVRVERLQDISDEQAQAEGIIPVPKTHERAHQFWRNYHLSGDGTFCVRTPRESFKSLWCHVAGGSFPKGEAAYKASPHSWDANPWVWCVNFKRVTP